MTAHLYQRGRGGNPVCWSVSVAVSAVLSEQTQSLEYPENADNSIVNNILKTNVENIRLYSSVTQRYSYCNTTEIYLLMIFLLHVFDKTEDKYSELRKSNLTDIILYNLVNIPLDCLSQGLVEKKGWVGGGGG